MPARNQAQCIAALHDKGVEPLQGAPGQPVTSLGKPAIRDAALPLAVLAQAAKERIEHDLLRLAPHGQQGCDKAGQRQFARAREGIGKLNMPGIAGKLSAVDFLGELGEQAG